MSDSKEYSAAQALADRRFKIERIDRIEAITLTITGKKLSSEKFDELIQDTVAVLDIKLSQAEEQLLTFKTEESSVKDQLKFED